MTTDIEHRGVPPNIDADALPPPSRWMSLG
jgi:hypothetical protein